MKMKVVLRSILVLFCLFVCYSQSIGQEKSSLKDICKQIIQEELSNKVGTEFSYYDQVDTIKIIRSYTNGFYDFYVVDSLYDGQENEITLITLFVPAQLLDKLSTHQTYLVNARPSSPDVTVINQDTVLIIHQDSWTYIIDLDPKTGKPKRPEKPSKPVKYFRIEKLKVLK
jgi:hypothetical protein